jgi:hypothetical protein
MVHQAVYDGARAAGRHHYRCRRARLLRLLLQPPPALLRAHDRR